MLFSSLSFSLRRSRPIPPGLEIEVNLERNSNITSTNLELEGLDVEEGLLELGDAVTPPKKDVIMAQRMVKGESSSHKKEVKSPPGMLTCRETIKNDQGSSFLFLQCCLLWEEQALWQRAPSEALSGSCLVPLSQAASLGRLWTGRRR